MQEQPQAQEERLDSHDIYQGLIDGLADSEASTREQPRVVRRAEGIGQGIIGVEEVSYGDMHHLFRQNGYNDGIEFLRDYAVYMREQEQTQNTLVQKLQEIPAITSEEEEIFI